MQGQCKPNAESSLYAEVQPVLACRRQSYDEKPLIASISAFISPTYSDNCPQGNISDFMQYFGSSAVIQFIKAIDALLAFYEPNSKLSGKVDLLEKYLQLKEKGKLEKHLRKTYQKDMESYNKSK